jgi:hypothetical protein
MNERKEYTWWPWPAGIAVLFVAIVLVELALIWGALYLHGDCELTPLYKTVWCVK